MALTAAINKVLFRGWGAKGNKVAIVTFTTDTDYAEGGYSVAGSLLGWNEISYISGGPSVVPATIKYVPTWDEANNKLMFIATADGAEAAVGVDELAGATFRCLVVGS
jgi:hypothetical protein